MRLIDAPVGLFLYKEKILCVKTEYTADWGVEAYIVSSGEILWGDAHTAEERNALEVTPVTIDPESLRPQGEWVTKSWWQRKNKYTVNVCSVCKSNVKPKLKPNYCPNCGAKMKGG